MSLHLLLLSVLTQVAYLQSYSGMGAARVSCESGCVCEAAAAAGLEVDAHDPRPVSVTSIADLRVRCACVRVCSKRAHEESANTA
mgnify:CR=1 FL=1